MEKNNTIILASSNAHKIEEIRVMFKDYNVLSLLDIGFTDEIIEDGVTFFDNALIKANAVYNFIKDKNLNALIIADDSGLCVDALNGAPGVFSARYSGNHNDKANRDKLLNELKNSANRDAHYECDIVLMLKDGEYKNFVGRCNGKITTEEIGDNDFGYNRIFYSNDLQKTFGQASIDERNSVSHRGRAISQVKEYLENN